MRDAPFVIDRVKSPSPEEFYRRYIARSRPALVTGVVDRWPAASCWRPEYFKARFPDVVIKYEQWEGDEAVNDPVDFFTRKQVSHRESMAAFVDRMTAAGHPTRKFYCAGFPIFDAIPELRDDVPSLEPYMGMPTWLPAALRRRLQFTPYLWMGPAGVLSTLHFDRTDNFFVQLHGRKKWIILPPGQSRYVYFPSPDLGSEVVHFSPVDVEHPDYERFPLFRRARPVEIVIEPGEMLYTPPGWWHYVRAVDASVSLNFFWLRPLASAVAMRQYFGVLARRTIARRLRLSRRRPSES